MIPFAILSGQLYMRSQEADRSRLEIRILDLSPDGFTFRVPCRFSELEKDTVEILLHFFQYGEKKYEPVRLRDFSISCEERERFWVAWRVETQDPDYQAAASLLTREYLRYVEGKLTLEDAELSEMMIGYPASEDGKFAPSWEAQRQVWIDEIRQNPEPATWTEAIQKNVFSLAAALDRPELVECYLELPSEQFYKQYLSMHQLEWHPLQGKKLEGILVGNSFCPLLCPDLQTMRRIIRKAAGENLEVGLMIAPVSESFWPGICTFLEALNHMVEEMWNASKRNSFRLLVNDSGTLLFCRQHFPELHAQPGILMNKRKKDPRIRYLKGADAEFCVDRAQDMVFFPFYQMNTSTFCTLHAIMERGDRGKQERVLSCPQYCREHVLLYPEHLSVVGKFNSLLGFCSKTLKDGTWTTECREEGVRWLVLNL